MPDSCFADRLSGLIELAVSERELLARLEERQRPIRRGTTLLREKERSSELFVLRKGMVISSVLMDDGRRQILRIHLPGDLMGMATTIYGVAQETLTAIRDSVVSLIDRDQFCAALATHARLAVLVMVMSQIERAALIDRLAGLGRTNARSRVAALLLEMRDRLRVLDGSITDTFNLGLTQEEIGDATGLTAVHVNRMLRQLEEEKMIKREAGHVTLINERQLARDVNYADRTKQLALSWLPPASG